MFFVYYLFICLIIFLHFYVNVLHFYIISIAMFDLYQLITELIFILELFLLFKVYSNVFTCKYTQIL